MYHPLADVNITVGIELSQAKQPQAHDSPGEDTDSMNKVFGKNTGDSARSPLEAVGTPAVDPSDVGTPVADPLDVGTPAVDPSGVGTPAAWEHNTAEAERKSVAFDHWGREADMPLH